MTSVTNNKNSSFVALKDYFIYDSPLCLRHRGSGNRGLSMINSFHSLIDTVDTEDLSR